MRDPRDHRVPRMPVRLAGYGCACTRGRRTTRSEEDRSSSLSQQLLRSLSLVLAVLFCSCASPPDAVGGAAAPSELQVRFQQLDTSSYPEITCYFMVTEQNEPVLGLTRQEISVTVDDMPLSNFRLRSVTDEGANIAVALAIDTSGSMSGRPLTAAQSAAREFIGRLSEADQAAVITFGATPVTACEFMTERARLIASVEAATARGNTALYDAVLLALDQLAQQPSPRKALLVLTDGKDTESQAGEDSCLERARGSDVPVFSVGLGTDVNRDLLQALADHSGGECFFTTDSGDLLVIYQRIAEQLNSQYVLSYRDPQVGPEAGPWHEAAVEVQYASQTASASRRYLEIVDTQTETPNGRGPSPMLLVVIAMAVLDLALLVGWLLRRRAGVKLRG